MPRKKNSAGIALYRRSQNQSGFEVLLAKPGGPFWTNKHEHEYGVVKGEFDPSTEDPLTCARREWREETGTEPPEKDDLNFLGSFQTSSSKTIHIYVAEGDFEVSNLQSNLFEMEWPPRSGVYEKFPEVEKAAWIDLASAELRLHKNQAAIASAMRTYLST